MGTDSQLNNAAFSCSETQDAFSMPHVQSVQACSTAGLWEMTINHWRICVCRVPWWRKQTQKWVQTVPEEQDPWRGAGSLEQAVPIPVCPCLIPSALQGFESGLADGGSSAAFSLA